MHVYYTCYGILRIVIHICFTVLTPADAENHVDKHPFKIPFVCGARNLGEALRRILEGAAMIRTKGEAGTGNFFSSGTICLSYSIQP